MKEFKVVAITHRKADLETVGRFHIDPDKAGSVLRDLKEKMGWDELMYLSTCNRVEFIISSFSDYNPAELAAFFGMNDRDFYEISEQYVGQQAVDHLFRVASSLDSMVIGEREIITQVRNAFDTSKSYGLTGDNIRLLVRKTIENAKRVYTETGISHKPISVVSLAFRELKDYGISPDTRMVVIGAGQTNQAMARFISKAGLKEVHVFNRTPANAQNLANIVGGKAYGLDALKTFTDGFDVILTCTGSEAPVLTKEIYSALLGGDPSRKLIIDLAVPVDTEAEILKSYPVEYLSVETLRPIAEKNLKERSGEVQKCEEILSESLIEFSMMYSERQVERAMSDLPQQVKDLRNHALSNVFAADIDGLDSSSREVLDRVLDYMEKKYISGPMKMAKEIILNKKHVR